MPLKRGSCGQSVQCADPGPRPVGRRTSARPVGRLGDGVGADNCAYKSIRNFGAILIVHYSI